MIESECRFSLLAVGATYHVLSRSGQRELDKRLCPLRQRKWLPAYRLRLRAPHESKMDRSAAPHGKLDLLVKPAAAPRLYRLHNRICLNSED